MCQFSNTKTAFVIQGSKSSTTKLYKLDNAQKVNTLLNTKKHLALGIKPLKVKVVRASEVEKHPDYKRHDRGGSHVLLIKGKNEKYLACF